LYFIPGVQTGAPPALGVIPPLLILTMTAFKDLVENIRRWRTDTSLNKSPVYRYNRTTHRYQKCQWWDLNCGDIIILLKDDPLPADVLLLNCSDEEGIAYIETKDLDGESNLKQKRCVNFMEKPKKYRILPDFRVADHFNFKVNCDQPNDNLDRFDGSIEVISSDKKLPGDEQKKFINNDNVVLRGCTVRNTLFIEGLVVYTGHDTKIMLNNSESRYKKSKMERKRLSIDGMYSFLLLIIIAIFSSIMAVQGNDWWCDLIDCPPNGTIGLLGFVKMIVFLNQLIPISLYLTIELVKIFQIWFMNRDDKMVDNNSGDDDPKRLVCKNTTIPEDLGQIQYVFSDKTGTLTENKMVFKRCNISGIEYAHGMDKQGTRIGMTPKGFYAGLGQKDFKSVARQRMSAIVNAKEARTSITRHDELHNSAPAAMRTFSLFQNPLGMINKKRPSKLENSKDTIRRATRNSKTSKEDIPIFDVDFFDDLDERPAMDSDILQISKIDLDLQASIQKVRSYESLADDLHSKTPHRLKVLEFLTCLSICNTVVLSKDTAKKMDKKLAEHDDDSDVDSSDSEEGFITKFTKKILKKTDSEDLELNTANLSAKMQENQAKGVKMQPKKSVTFNESEKVYRIDSDEELTTSKRRKTVHEVVADTQIHYEAESPDEAALVYAAKAYDVHLLQRSTEDMSISVPNFNKRWKFKIHHIFPFNSDRKRMSIVVTHPVTKERILYCKGADNIILGMLSDSEENDNAKAETQKMLDHYAKSGLRTLCLGRKILNEEVYQKWKNGTFHHAENATENKDEQMAKAWAELENGLELLGATGIEDRLQDEVPETITALRQAGLKVWVITGDKVETAINIAHSCCLFNQEDERLELVKVPPNELNAKIEDYISYCQSKFSKAIEPENSVLSISDRVSSMTSLVKTKVFRIKEHPGHAINRYQTGTGPTLGVVIDGVTLTRALKEDIRYKFLKLTKYTNAVLCCRATPKQKGELVNLVKESLDCQTLAIGDGANDVSMIQVADVGIGISGLEGMQAVMNSDFAIPKFRFLKRLLLVHGHWNYYRLGAMTLYFFYKNVAFVMVPFWFQFVTRFSGANSNDEICQILFSTIFTSIPPLVQGLFERNVDESVLERNPKLYQQGVRSKVYSKKYFWYYWLMGAYHAFVCFIVPCSHYFLGSDSNLDLRSLGWTTQTSVLIANMVSQGIEYKSWTFFHWAAIFISVGIYILAALGIGQIGGNTFKPNSEGLVTHVFSDLTFWMIIILCVAICCLPHYIYRIIVNDVFPTETMKAQQEYMEEEKKQEAEDAEIGYKTNQSKCFCVN